MSAIEVPKGNIIIPQTPFSHQLLLNALKGINSRTERNFSGYLALSASDRLYLLFIFNSRPYAAGVSVGEKPAPLTITNFCSQVASLAPQTCLLSLHETDPVLLKSLLIFIQDEPTAKAPASLINLEDVVRQINDEKANALVILESGSSFNMFFFKDGTRGLAYWADNDSTSGRQGLGIADQMLLYAFQEAGGHVEALVYRNIATMEARDSYNMTLEGLIHIFEGSKEPEKPMTEMRPQAEKTQKLNLKVVEGPQAGTVLTGAIPSVLGRKDADILILDQMVSKRHATIQMINGKLVLIDLNSTNGTTLNGEKVGQRELRIGDRLGIGQSVLLLESVSQ